MTDETALSSPAEALTTTSFAILGQLALRSWTTYELAAEIRRNLHYFWPRAESLIYTEAKRLARLGYATAAMSYIGKRKRTVYSISPAGQEVIEAWLATPPKPAMLEFEGLLRVLYAPLTSQQNLMHALAQVQADNLDLLQLSSRVATEYLDGQAPFQEDVHRRVFVWDFLTRYAELLRDWTTRTRATLDSWEPLTIEEQRTAALQFFATERARRR